MEDDLTGLSLDDREFFIRMYEACRPKHIPTVGKPYIFSSDNGLGDKNAFKEMFYKSK